MDSQINNKTFKTSPIHHFSHLWCGLLWKCNFRVNLFSIEIMNPKLNDFLDCLGFREGDEPKSPGVLGGGVPHNHGLCHRPELAKILLQTFYKWKQSELI